MPDELENEPESPEPCLYEGDADGDRLNWEIVGWNESEAEGNETGLGNGGSLEWDTELENALPECEDTLGKELENELEMGNEWPLDGAGELELGLGWMVVLEKEPIGLKGLGLMRG